MSSLSKNHLGRQGHDHANTIKSNKEKLRPQPEVTTHYQAHPYNLNINSFPGRANPGGHHVELPTTEEPSGSSIGIGSMPGSNFEAGVATLPEEREGGKPYGTFRTGFEDYSPAKGGLHPKLSKGEGHDGNSVYKDTLADHHLVRELGHDHLATSKWEIPSTEVPSGSRQGVGSLPGNPGEAGVAILPEERKVQENPPRRSFSHRMPLPAAAHDQQEADVVPADHVLKHEAEEKKGLETGGITGGIPHRSYSSFLDLGDGNQDKATAQTGSGSSTTRSPVLHSNVTSDVLESLGWDVDALSLEDRFPEPRDPRERVLEERLMRVEAAQKLAEVDRRTESERVEKEMNHGATADRMAKGLNEVVVEFEGKAKELYHGAEGTIFGILHPEEQRRQAALAKLDKGELAKLQAGNWERFEAQERRRLETDMRAMVEDEPSRKNSVSSSSRSESSITIFNADRKLRLPTPAPDTHLGKSTVLESTSLDSSESQQPPQSEDKNKLEVRRAQLLAELKENMALSLSQAVKEFEEQASNSTSRVGWLTMRKGLRNERLVYSIVQRKGFPGS
ncbi:hypothetical protein BKA70DRAFT_67464 [Coprinopsis sp. MPI-PUGE-AT-0042]|nr:hypothetical protein BKA70DRAFT_67464 [Coprinopsis sp. MPI-PUGE-AT-0042]